MKTETEKLMQKVDIHLDEEFDPLEDLEPFDEDETDEFYGKFEAQEDTTRATVIEDNRPAAERIDELFNRMKLRRRVLIGILDFCREPKSVEETNALVATLQENDRSVFSAASFCAALEQAGALTKMNADGQIIDEEAAHEPEVVELDGVKYLEAKPVIAVFWQSTPEGLAAVEADKPLERLHKLFETDAIYTPIYKRILNLCAAEEGASADDLGAAVDADPLVQEPRLFAPHFFEKLERCDALMWSKTWRTTEIGEQGLELLAEVDDAHGADATGENNPVGEGE